MTEQLPSTINGIPRAQSVALAEVQSNPSGADSTSLTQAWLREARAWANMAIALEGKQEE